MAGLPRPAVIAPARRTNMRPPPRPLSRANAAAPAPRTDRYGAASPAESVASNATNITTINAGTKRKERDFEQEGEETNINVVVRCRGRNEREVRENSGVVLTTDGVKGKSVDLSMGPSALSNKTYHFDKVFAPAADQSTIYDEVVTPILDEMLAGFNCTIFAYGQTGTGKTYTMSGDMTDTLGILSDAAGIIPRALHSLFKKLEIDEAESSVKCSFIELYNEELRDLISADENTKLKVFDDTSKKGHSSTIVQGMEESHIRSAAEGVKLLQAGSHRRQVAATKCNDMSSRSHTVFTVTAYVKRTGDNGEDYISAGKLNLVDLAGSENIQRSGAENKRAAEAGLINKSLLTLGRVINALVDKSSHIPYRESKLTRLLQDSLGGRTKTCIIATVSPAKSNLEETISTLDYAFRAKNIRNKPQINQMINKKTLLKEFTYEIEKLKSELVATRQRNGVYLSNENFEEITVESESRRILVEEQSAKIDAMESNLRHKVQELFALTSNFMTVKKDHEGTRLVLDQTKSVLEQTEFVLAATQQSLAEETVLRKAHEETEEKLSVLGEKLISTLGKTIHDVDGLHSKIRRKSDLQSMNQDNWSLSQARVSEVTGMIESRIRDFQTQQGDLMDSMSSRMNAFVGEELGKLASTRSYLEANVASFEVSEQEVSKQSIDAKEELDNVLEEIKTLREDVKARVGEGLQGLSTAAERISAEVISELGTFHSQLHSSYSSIGKDFKTLFEDLTKHISSQQAEANDLRRQLHTASEVALQANATSSTRLEAVLHEERQQAATDRQTLLSQITSLVNLQGEAQDTRLGLKVSELQRDISLSKDTFESALSSYDTGMNSWNDKESKMIEDVYRSRETLKSKLKDDWTVANKHNASIQTATKSVHEETVRIVDQQMKDIDSQMQALDDFVTRARSQNAQHHDLRSQSLGELSTNVKSSYANVGDHFTSTFDRVRSLDSEMSAKTRLLQDSLSPLDSLLCQPLSDLRSSIGSTLLQDYTSTGETPQKTQYQYPTELPRTGAHASLVAALRRPGSAPAPVTSPSKSNTIVFQDSLPGAADASHTHPLLPTLGADGVVPAEGGPNQGHGHGLREIDLNLLGTSGQRNSAPDNIMLPATSATVGTEQQAQQQQRQQQQQQQPPMFKRSVTAGSGRDGSSLKVSQRSLRKPAVVAALEGRENNPLALAGAANGFSQSVGGRRRSPRTQT